MSSSLECPFFNDGHPGVTRLGRCLTQRPLSVLADNGREFSGQVNALHRRVTTNHVASRIGAMGYGFVIVAKVWRPTLIVV